jgi:hypothetical protein
MRNHRRGSVVDGHADLHSELGPNRGEHSGRAINPTIKVADLAWLEFDKPDLKRAESFARDFGFVVAASKPDALYLRGSLPGTPAMVIRKGAHSGSSGRRSRPLKNMICSGWRRPPARASSRWTRRSRAVLCG